MRQNTWLLLGVVGLLAGGCGSTRKAPTLYGTAPMPASANENARTTVLPFVVREISQDETYG